MLGGQACSPAGRQSEVRTVRQVAQVALHQHIKMNSAGVNVK